MARVLLAEDEFLIRLVLAEELTAAGHVVVEAESGDDALAIAETDAPYDILVTDVQMPNMSGLELLQRLKAGRSELPVIVRRPELSSKIAPDRRPLARVPTILDPEVWMNGLPLPASASSSAVAAPL